MPKHVDQHVDSLALPEESSVRRKRTSGKEPRCASRWTEEEDAFIERHYKSMTDAAMAAALGCSKWSVGKRRTGVLQLPKSATPARWSAEDNAMLRALYGQVDTIFLAAVLSCPERRMRQQAERLGLRASRFWSHEEDKILKTHFPCMPINDFIELLPCRSLHSIYRRANTLTLSRGLPYLLSNWNYSKFHMYPPERKSLIHLHLQVKRKLQDVQTQH